jgi:hypothetical protein
MRCMSVRGARVLFVLVCASVALLMVPTSAFAVRTMGLSSGTFRFDLKAGQEATGSVDVMNDGDEVLKVMVYAADQRVDAKGKITYITPSRTDLQTAVLPSSWTSIKMPADSKAIGNVPYMEIKPKQRIPVSFKVLVPEGVASGDHNLVIFFESFEPPTPGQGAKTSVIGRLGARVRMRVAGELVRKLEVRPFNVPAYVLDTKIPFSFTVRNLGNLDQRVGARVLLLDRGGNEVDRRTAIDGVTVFAGTNLESSGTAMVKGFPLGPFKVRLDISPVDDAGKALNAGADQITQSSELWVIPMWTIVVAVLLLLALFVWIIWSIAAKATRRNAEKAAPPAAS